MTPARRWIGAHRVRAKRGSMAGSGVFRHLATKTADHDPPYGLLRLGFSRLCLPNWAKSISESRRKALT